MAGVMGEASPTMGRAVSAEPSAAGVSLVTFPELGKGVPPGPPIALESLGDVTMTVSVILGRAVLTVGEVLGLVEGGVIELDRSPGSPVDVRINGTLLAKADVVVVDEEFGARLSEMVSEE